MLSVKPVARKKRENSKCYTFLSNEIQLLFEYLDIVDKRQKKAVAGVRQFPASCGGIKKNKISLFLKNFFSGS